MSKKMAIRRQKLYDGSEKVIYVPEGVNPSVFEVVEVEPLNDDGKIRIVSTNQIQYVNPSKIKDYQGNHVIYSYIGKKEDVLPSDFDEIVDYSPDDTFMDLEVDIEDIGDLRYDSLSGTYKSYPDYLGGMESEEDFFEH